MSLLELGALLVRLREAPLGSSGIMSVSSSPDDADGLLMLIAAWVRRRGG